MKILKYLLFFLLIGFVGGSLFLSTLDGTYRVKRTILTKAPIELAFEVVNDYKTWQYWEPWNETNSTVEYSFPAQTVGVDATFSWKSTGGNGNIKNISSIPNATIQEIIYLDGKGTLNGTWQFKEVADGVEITWEIYGEMPFFTRFKSANMETETGSMLERGLALLEVYLQNELKKFSIETVGAVNYSGGYYVYQTTSGQFQDITYKTNELIVNLTGFLKNNAIMAYGKPFNIYHKRDDLLKMAVFSTGIPIQNQLILTDKTVMVGILQPQRTFKTILKGHYDNATIAWETAYKNLEIAGFKAKENGISFEVFVSNPKEVSNPTKWITEIYIPIEDEITIAPSSALRVKNE
jgi:effector-binding domain-containing protein/ribosome-associated toxin RatA of RatAB toxin-antitoxin module